MSFARIVVLACIGFISPLAAAADWPQWGGTDNRNMVSDQKGLPDVFFPIKNLNDVGPNPTTPTHVKWVSRLGGACYGNPTVANGRVFVGTDDVSIEEDKRFTRTQGGMVKCFDEQTGKLLWQLVVPKRTGFPKEIHYSYQYLGTCSSPLVDGDRVYVVTNACEVLCLDVHGQANGNDGPYQDEGQYMAGAGKPPVKLKETDADIIWRYDLMDELNIKPHDNPSCSILVHGDVLYLSTSNGVDHPHLKMLNPDAPAIIALDKRTGKLLAVEDEKISTRVWHCQWSPPSLGVVGGKTLVFFGGGDGWCYAFEALSGSGSRAPGPGKIAIRNPEPGTRNPNEEPAKLKCLWRFDCNPPQYKFKDGKPIPYIVGDKRKKDSPNKNDGNYVGPSEVIDTPVFHNGRIYVATGQDPMHGRGRGILNCIDASKSGDITQSGKVWSYDGLDRTIASPTIADGLVYIPDIAGRIHCLDADTGKLYWVYETKAETWGSILVADGKLYFGTAKEFYVMAAGKEARVLNHFNVGAQIYSSPIVANGVLYVASQRYLWAVRKTAQ